MATNVIGLFNNSNDAASAFTGLIEGGFDARDIQLRERGPLVSELYEELRDHGVPERDARLYVTGVQRGETLLIARINDDFAAQAQNILNYYKPLDLNDDYRPHPVQRVAEPNHAAAIV